MPKAPNAGAGRPLASSSRPGRSQRAGRAGGDEGVLNFDSAEEALDAAVGIEERAERFARAQGDKARRLFEEALTVYFRAIELGGDASAHYNAGRTALVLATGFYTPLQARPALEAAISLLLTALSTRLSSPDLGPAGSASAALLGQVGEEIKATVTLLEVGSEAALADILGRPAASALPSLKAAESDSADTVDPFVVDIISSAASTLQALAELDDHYGIPHAATTPRATFLRVPTSAVKTPVNPLVTMVSALRMSALSCACFLQAIDASSLRAGNDVEAPRMAAEPAKPVASGPDDDDAVMTAEPSLSSTYEGSTNPLTPSGYAEALADCYTVSTVLISMADGANVGTELHAALLGWALATGQAILSEANRLTSDLARAGSDLDETERADSIQSLAPLKHGPFLLRIAALIASESRRAGPQSTQDASFRGELVQLEAALAGTAEDLLERVRGPSPPSAEELCDIADAASSLSQLRIRLDGFSRDGSEGTGSLAIRSDAMAAAAAWAMATATAKLLVKAYAIVDASDAGGVLGSGTNDGRGGLLSERQRTQLSISLSLAQVSILRLHPFFNVLRAAQPAEEARKTIDALRANTTAYARRALQQAGLRWVLQYADDAAKRHSPTGSKLNVQWVNAQAQSLEHDERVLHDGWEVLALRVETVLTALRASWFKLVGQGSSIPAAIGAAVGNTIKAQQELGTLLQSTSAGAETIAMLECLAALVRAPSSGTISSVSSSSQADKARESAEIARAWAGEVFVPPSPGAEPGAGWCGIRLLAELDADDGSVSVRGSGPHTLPASAVVVDGTGAIFEADFWEWASHTLLSSGST